MQWRQVWLREYLLEEGYEPKRFVGSASLTDDPASIAASIRTTLGLTENWAESVRTWEDALVRILQNAENAGIMVVRNGVVGNTTSRKLEVTEFRGFVLVDDYAPLIFINSSSAGL